MTPFSIDTPKKAVTISQGCDPGGMFMDSQTARIIALSGFLGVGLGATSALAAVRYASHPFLFKAKSDLTHAKLLLQRTTHDCGGHRAVALQKINDALTEVTTALQYADAHPQEDSKQTH